MDLQSLGLQTQYPLPQGRTRVRARQHGNLCVVGRAVDVINPARKICIDRNVGIIKMRPEVALPRPGLGNIGQVIKTVIREIQHTSQGVGDGIELAKARVTNGQEIAIGILNLITAIDTALWLIAKLCPIARAQGQRLRSIICFQLKPGGISRFVIIARAQLS